VLDATSTWDPRDLPILRAIVEISDEGMEWIEPEQLVERTGLDLSTVKAGLFALADEDPPHFKYVEFSSADSRDLGSISRPTGHARRTVDMWPTPEDRVTELIEALNRAAEKAPDPEPPSARWRDGHKLLSMHPTLRHGLHGCAESRDSSDV
jgi:hypothetical protein